MDEKDNELLDIPVASGTDSETEGTTVPAEPVSKHRREHKLSFTRLQAGTVLGATIVVSAGITYGAMQPTLAGLNDDLDDATARNSGLTSTVESLEMVRDVCRKAAAASSGSLEHWAHYMDSVQDMLLASSSRAVDKAMPGVQASYRAVVRDKVPTADALDECLEAG